MPGVHDRDAVGTLRRELGIQPLALQRLRNAFYKHGEDESVALLALPESAREAFVRSVEFHELELIERVESSADHATRLLFSTRDGLRVESVVLRSRFERATLCVSAQVGCGAACVFCATGTLGLRRNLRTAEILDQVIMANRLLRDEGTRIRNVVFMGMGEPFHNEANVLEALDVLADPQCFDLTLKHVSVSTVGVPDAMRRCAARFPRVRLALSLHAAREDVRCAIIPLAARHPLSELRDAVADANRHQQHDVMLEYLLLDSVNDTDADLEAAVEFAAGLRVQFNLIPWNPIDGAPTLRATPRPRREEFAQALRKRGFAVRLRHSLGPDVAAACGQLVRRENVRGPRAD